MELVLRGVRKLAESRNVKGGGPRQIFLEDQI